MRKKILFIMTIFFTINASLLLNSCKNKCEENCVHGRCLSKNKCHCDVGWEGKDCNKAVNVSSFGTNLSFYRTQNNDCGTINVYVKGNGVNESAVVTHYSTSYNSGCGKFGAAN